MAVLTVTAPNGGFLPGYDYTPSLGELLNFENAQLTNATSTRLEFNLGGGFSVRIEGTGFAYDSGDNPTAGTVTLTGTLVLKGSGQPWSAAS